MRTAVLFVALIGAVGFATAADDPKQLAKNLKHKDAKVRLKAAQDAGKLGKDAEPIARELCDAVADASKGVATAALASLEAVRPDLYKPVSTLALDRDPNQRENALISLKRMGETAAPVAGLLAARVKAGFAARLAQRPEVSLDREPSFALDALTETIGTGNDDVAGYVLSLAATATAYHADRQTAARAFKAWAGADDDRRKRLLPVVKGWLAARDLVVPGIGLAAELGPLAKDYAEPVRKLKLSDRADVRAAAESALPKIEGK